MPKITFLESNVLNYYLDLVSRLKNCGVPMYKIAEESGVSQSTLSRITSPDYKSNPRIKTLEPLELWLHKFETSATVLGDAHRNRGVSDTPPAVRDQGKNQDDCTRGLDNLKPGRSRDWNAIRARAIAEKTNAAPK